MAITVTKVVDPDMGSGYDYDSLYDWEAAQQGDLTGVRNEIAVAKCRCTGGTADTTAFAINGWTTSAADYIKIWTDTSESYRHNGTYQTGNKYRLEISNAGAISNLEENIRFIGLQIRLVTINNSDQYATDHQATGAVDIQMSYCILRGTNDTGSTQNYHWGVYCRSAASGTYKFWNNYIYDFQAVDARWPIGIGSNNAGITVYAYNNTIKNCYYGLYQNAGSFIAKNNGISGCTQAIREFSEGDISQTTNSTSTPTFEADGIHLAVGDTTWKGAATNLYNDANLAFQDDIDGQDRGGAAASWDIGADEYVALILHNKTVTKHTFLRL